MGYYNQPPGHQVAEKLTDLERLLRALLPLDQAIAALDLLETLTRNVVQNPTDEKKRRLRTTNEKLQTLFGLEGAVDLMQEIGWQWEDETYEFMVLPQSVKLSMPMHVSKILEAKSWYNKQLEAAKRASKMTQDPNKAHLLKQLEQDRRERGQTGAAPPPAAAPAPPAPVEASKPAPAPVVEAPKAPSKPCPTKSAFDFESRQKKEDVAKEAEASLHDLRAMQKAKYKEFETDPNARKSEAYQRPASTGGGQEAGWFDWMWGSSSSSSGGGGGGYNGRDDKRPPGPRMKTINDLPKPVRRGGG